MGSAIETRAEEGLIRLAEPGDVEQIISFVWGNAGDTEYLFKLIYREDTLRLYVGAVLADPQARILVYESAGEIRGVFAFTVVANFYQFGGELTASLIAWSVAKSSRGRISMKLLSAGQREARKLGATRFLLTGPGEKFQNLCEHCEFNYLESTYVKVLTPDQRQPRPVTGKAEILKGAAIIEMDGLSRQIGNGPFYPGLGIAAVKRDETGQIVAFTAVRIVLHAAGSYVAPEHRGNGISYELRTALEDALRAEKVSEYYSMPGSDFERELFAKYGHVEERLVQVKEL